ncbi:hemerythrin family protein [Ferrovibrio sp.]|jgi:hemerythrin-like metal-binding protein|uniref:hemerythrin family protein n=1 Tax=Ferrovibrio sp. TaxID=1917215 RepID=UPI0035B1AAA9
MSVFKLPMVAEFGFGNIDAEHQDIADCINDCLVTAAKGNDALPLQHLTMLRQKMAGHFRNEEALMEDLGFPLLAPHRGHHRNILDKLDRLQADCARKGGVSLNDVRGFLEGLIEDVLHADLPFKTFLYEREILR